MEVVSPGLQLLILGRIVLDGCTGLALVDHLEVPGLLLQLLAVDSGVDLLLSLLLDSLQAAASLFLLPLLMDDIEVIGVEFFLRLMGLLLSAVLLLLAVLELPLFPLALVLLFELFLSVLVLDDEVAVVDL